MMKGSPAPMAAPSAKADHRPVATPLSRATAAASDSLVARQLAMVGRLHGLTVAQENACRRTIPHYAELERAAVDLRRRAARRPFKGGY